MTEQEAIEMIEAKKKCMENETSGDFELCNRQCDGCKLNYTQGNLGEQIKWLGMAINALEEQEYFKNKISNEYGSKLSVKEFFDLYFEQFEKHVGEKPRKVRILTNEDADLYDKFKESGAE